MRAGTHIDLPFWCKSRCFACTKRHVRSETLRGLLFWSIRRCFASKKCRWGLGPVEASNSDARHAVLHAQNGTWLAPELLVYMGPSPHLWFLHAKQRLLDQHNKSLCIYRSQTSPVVLCMQNSVICSRLTNLYVFQPASVVLWMQNSDFRTRLTSLYGSQTSSEVLST